MIIGGKLGDAQLITRGEGENESESDDGEEKTVGPFAKHPDLLIFWSSLLRKDRRTKIFYKPTGG
jgi:hypothetical protein